MICNNNKFYRNGSSYVNEGMASERGKVRLKEGKYNVLRGADAPHSEKFPEKFFLT